MFDAIPVEHTSYASSDRLNNLHLFVSGTTSMAGRFVVPAIPILQIPVYS